jgi:uncharacterized protein
MVGIIRQRQPRCCRLSSPSTLSKSTINNPCKRLLFRTANARGYARRVSELTEWKGAVPILALAQPRRYSGQRTWPLGHLSDTKPDRFKVTPRLFTGPNGQADMVDHHGRFAWYELMTTDMAGARAFYGTVLGWGAQEASTPDLTYTVFTAGKTAVTGLMELPAEARKMGATPRWMGYVGVNDMDVATARIKRLGGAVYVPPTDSNIGRISVVADPQTATLALVKGLTNGQREPAALGRLGHVGWHELLAADWQRIFAFYGELFDWQKAEAEIGPTETYQLFSIGAQTIGGMFTKRPEEPLPFWLFYFNIDDIDAAAERVKTAGGGVFEGPYELPDGIWIVRCTDPQGAAFALQGKRGHASEVGWTTEWGGFSSKGRLRVPKPPR